MRLTDTELDDVATLFPTHLGKPVRSVLIQRAIAEIRERRARDLNSEEREALRSLYAMLSRGDLPRDLIPPRTRDVALAALAKGFEP